MLSCDELRNKYPKLLEYFEKGIKNPDKNIAHCILFYGTDLDVQYNLALEIARLLNCNETGDIDCDCLNCRWIKENAHPAVQTISKVDNKGDDDKSSTVISIEQARKIKNDLLVTSDYHRVLIFCDKDKDGNVCGLSGENFQEPTANALLKTFEEPPHNTTFFFLTKDKSDVISTVLSRAQSFFVPSMLEENHDCSLVKSIMDDFLEIERSQVLDFNERLLALTGENEPMEVLKQIQNYLGEVLENNYDNRLLRQKLIKDLHTVETAKMHLGENMNVQTVFENMSFSLVL